MSDVPLPSPKSKKPRNEAAVAQRKKDERKKRQMKAARKNAKKEAAKKRAAEQKKAEQAAEQSKAKPMQPQPPKPAVNPQLRKPARRAQTKSRHVGLIFAFVILVLAPVGASAWYLYTRAVDQYASTLGFVVRSEDFNNAADVFSGISTSIGGGSQHDSDILYEFIRSAQLVRLIDQKLDLAGAFSRYVDQDPLMSYHPGGTIEDLTAFWRRNVRISYDTASGLIEVRVLAFDPHEAQDISQEIYDQSSRMINRISAIAREDATRYAQQDLDLAVERLKTAREALTVFRLENEIVDPVADIQGQMGLLNTLQAQLAGALIELDLLGEGTREGDPRLEQAKRRIQVIESRIADERRKFGAEGQGPGGDTYAETISEFERLSVDREFAERAYEAAQAAYDAARTEANRQSRYLAAYIEPSLAERAEFPQRVLLLAIVALFSFLIWTIGSLIFYALRDRA